MGLGSGGFGHRGRGLRGLDRPALLTRSLQERSPLGRGRFSPTGSRRASVLGAIQPGLQLVAAADGLVEGRLRRDGRTPRIRQLVPCGGEARSQSPDLATARGRRRPELLQLGDEARTFLTQGVTRLLIRDAFEAGGVSERGQGERPVEGQTGHRRQGAEEVEGSPYEGPSVPAGEDEDAVRRSRVVRCLDVEDRPEGKDERRLERSPSHPLARLGKGLEVPRIIDAKGRPVGQDLTHEVVPRHRPLVGAEREPVKAVSVPEHHLARVERGGVAQQRAEGPADAVPTVRVDRSGEGEQAVGEVNGHRRPSLALGAERAILRPDSIPFSDGGPLATAAGVGFSDNPRSRDAGAEAARAALEQAGSNRCGLAIVYATGKHDPTLLRDGIRSVVGPGPRLIGGYAVGIITRDRLGYEGFQVGVAVVSSDTVKIDMFIESGLREDERRVGADLGVQIRSRSYAGEPNILLMYDAVKGPAAEGASLNMATPLLEGLHESLGAWPRMAGVGMFGDLQFNPTFQWFDDRIEQQAAMALVLSGGVRMDTVIMHGCKPSSGYHTVTKAEQNVVLEIDGKPALDLVGELLGPDFGWESYPLFVTLGENKGDKFGPFREEDYANHLCMALDRERRGLVMFEPNLAPGCEVQLMRRSIDFEYIGKRAGALLGALEDRLPFLALYIDCAGRASVYCGTEREEGEEVQKVVGPRMPLLGMYSGVEIAKVGRGIEPLDWTGVLCVFSE